MDHARAKALLEQFGRCRIAVIGDLILDRYIRGTAERISPEAPVPVVRVQSEEAVLGGAANVLRNLAALGAVPLAFGVTGEDAGDEEIRSLCAKWQIPTENILRLANRQTTVKTRIIADNQQVVRIDDEAAEPIDAAVASQLLERLRRAAEANTLDAMIIEDYNKGVVTPVLAREIQALAATHGLASALDPHPANPLEVKGLTLMTPNRTEAFTLARTYPRPTVLPLSQDQALGEVAAKLIAVWEPENLLITLGSAGMALFGKDGALQHIPTVAQEVFDVSGAGDTVIAVCTAALLAGASSREAAELANHAAGIVVGKLGTVCVEAPELLASFDASD